MCVKMALQSLTYVWHKDYKSFVHLFKQYTLGQAVVEDAKLDHVFLVPEDLSV